MHTSGGKGGGAHLCGGKSCRGLGGGGGYRLGAHLCGGKGGGAHLCGGKARRGLGGLQAGCTPLWR